MKKLAALFIFIISFTNLFGQKYFSKMFDIYGEWESFTNIIEIKNNSFSFFCDTREIFASDSTRFSRMVLIKYDKNFNVINKTTIGKNFYNPTLPMLINVLKNKFIYGLIDTTQNNLKYFICNYDSNLNIKNITPLVLPNKNQITYPGNVYLNNNK